MTNTIRSRNPQEALANNDRSFFLNSMRAALLRTSELRRELLAGTAIPKLDERRNSHRGAYEGGLYRYGLLVETEDDSAN